MKVFMQDTGMWTPATVPPPTEKVQKMNRLRLNKARAWVPLCWELPSLQLL